MAILCRHLKGDRLDVVSGLGGGESAYNEALNRLLDPCGRRDVIGAAHLQETRSAFEDLQRESEITSLTSAELVNKATLMLLSGSIGSSAPTTTKCGTTAAPS